MQATNDKEQEMFDNWQSLIGVFVLATLHWTAGRLRRPTGRPGWLSAASGISVAYVFIGLLPDLAEAQATWLEEMPTRSFLWLEHQIYLAALLGLLVYYALARTRGSETRSRFWLNLASFALYNLVIGILGSQLHNGLAVAIAVVAFGAHMLVNDFAFERAHAQLYARIGRPTLSISIVLGWLLGAVLPISHLLAVLLLGLVAGGIILNVMKEEMPEDRQGKLRPFIAGALTYAALLLTFYALNAQVT